MAMIGTSRLSTAFGRRVLSGTVCIAVVLAAASLVWAGNTGTTALFMPHGSGAGRATGDYISRNTTSPAGLNSPYRYFIEVPPGTSRLVVDIFDADIGLGGTAEAALGRDRQNPSGGAVWNTTANYAVYNPSGTLQTSTFSQGSSTAPAGADGTWLTLFDSSAGPAPVLQTQSVNTGSEVAALALNVPTGTAAGNLLVAAIARDLDGTSGAVAAPNGWTTLDQGTCPTNSCHLAVFYQVVTTVPSSPQTFTWTGNQRVAGAMFRFSGVDPTTPLDTTVATNSGSTTNPIAPAVTTSTSNALVLRMVGAGPDVAFAPPTGHTEIWDVGAGGGTSGTQVHGSAATATQSIPGGTGTATFTANTSRWRTATVALRPAALPAPTTGHWELRVDMSSAATTGDDINAFGIRAHDGDATDAGSELNVYYDSHTAFGVNLEGGTNPRPYGLYPWVTSGCECYEADFDYDSDSGTVGSIVLNDRNGTQRASFASALLSANDVWTSNTVPQWTTLSDSTGYGTWTAAINIATYPNNSNYSNVYFRNFQGAAPPPTANPTTNAFRVYLPTDTGTAPLKPYLEQFVRMTGGPAVTPVVGTTYRLTVTVRVENPTPHAITFSSSNLVTASVPGTIASGTVVYAGNLQYSQGSAPTTPGIGTSGNITWNPGTLAAGATALLAYEVDATPTAAGTLRVTGTPTTNGTTARYVDETGSSAARALITLGPVCEVGISTSAPTQAVLAGLWSHRHADGLVVSFMTASEVGTAGYRLERLSRTGNTFEVATDRAFLPALPAAPQGAVYHVVDRGADARAPQAYRVVELEATGLERDLGTYTLTPEDGPAPEMPASFVRAPRERRPAPELPAGSDPFTAAPVTGVKIAVESPGLYWLGSDDIATQFAVPVDEVRARIQTRGYALTNRGEAVAWLPGADGSGLYFVGEALDSIYARANVYLLKPGAGVLMMPPFTRQLPADRPLRVSATTLHTESDLFELTAAPLDPESDYWFWDYLEAGSPTHGRRPFTIVAPSASPAGGQATLVAQLLGATSTGVAGEHHALIYVNGVQVGEAAWQGVAAHQVTATFDQALLHEGANTVEVEARLESGVPYGFVFVDSFDLTYQRLHTAQASALEVAVAGSRAITVDGFADPTIRVFDLANPKRPTTLLQVQVAPGSAGFTVTFSTPMPTSGGPRHLLAVSESGIRHPARIWPDTASDLRSAGNAADYLVVTAGPLVATAEQLAAYRQGQGLAALVVDIEDVYDEFNAGLPSPHALRSFLAHAREAWAVAPRTVVLAGAGSYDYKDVLGLGGNLVPPLMVSSPGGIFASDARFGDLAGEDGVPEIAIGRLPVATPAELADAITKIAAYEAEGAAAWTGAAVVVADDPEDGFDFGLDSDTLASRLGGLVTEKLYLGPLTATEVHSRLLSAWNDGAAVITYLGHGGMDRWAQESVFLVSDVATLGNGPRLPLVASLTCVIGRFEVPGFECLGSALVKPPAAGAIGVWAPSGVANHADSLLLGQLFGESLGRDDVPTIGDACIRALADFHSGGGNPTTGRLYNYFGDPMIRLRPLPPPPPPEPGGTPGGDE